MSFSLREVVELTALDDGPAKAVLLHVADTMRGAEGQFWRSKGNVAKRLGFCRQTIKRKFAALEAAGLLRRVGERGTAFGLVDVYQLDARALLSLPCIEHPDRRAEILASARVAEPLGVGTESTQVGTESTGVGTESTTNHKNHINHISTEKRSKLDSALYPRAADHLRDDPAFAAWVAEQEAGR